MARRLFTLLSALSLLLGMLMSILWLTNSIVTHSEVFDRIVEVEAFNGGVYVTLYRRHPPPITAGTAEDQHSVWIFGYSENASLQRVMFPAWFGVVAMATLPLFWSFLRFRGHRTRRRLEARLCLSCGYDLRATPGRCPECGTTAAAQKA
jgi:hypothetical protein